MQGAKNESPRDCPQYTHNAPGDWPGGICADSAHTLGAAEILLAELDAAGVVLSIVTDGLEFDGPDDVLTDELLSLMRRYRAELLALVERREERLAIVKADRRARWQSMPIVCPWCKSERLVDNADVLNCALCGQVAWMVAVGSLIRADVIDDDLFGVHPDDVDVCPDCGDLFDIVTTMGCGTCSRCSPNRVDNTARWLRARERILRRRG